MNNDRRVSDFLGKDVKPRLWNGHNENRRVIPKQREAITIRIGVPREAGAVTCKLRVPREVGAGTCKLEVPRVADAVTCKLGVPREVDVHASNTFEHNY